LVFLAYPPRNKKTCKSKSFQADSNWDALINQEDLHKHLSDLAKEKELAKKILGIDLDDLNK